MKRILEVLGSIRDTAIFVIYDNTSASDLTKEERIALMDEYRQKEETARAQKGEKDRALRAAGEAYMETEEYIYAGAIEKVWIVVKYGLIYNNYGEMVFDELRKMWYYTDGKAKVYIKETYIENGPTFTECLLKAFLYEVDHLDDDQPKKES